MLGSSLTTSESHADPQGMSAAYAMSLSPDKFDVTVFDKEKEAGGMATSVRLRARSIPRVLRVSRFPSMQTDMVQATSTTVFRVVHPSCKSVSSSRQVDHSPFSYNTIRMFEILGFK